MVDENAEERSAEEIEQSKDLTDAVAEEQIAQVEATEEMGPVDDQEQELVALSASDQEADSPESPETDQPDELSSDSDEGDSTSSDEEADGDEPEEAETEKVIEEEELEEEEVEEEVIEEEAKEELPTDISEMEEEAVAVPEEVEDESEDQVEPETEAVAESEPAVDADVAEEAPAAVAEDDRHWYVVHCYSGYENKVRHNLEQRIETMGMKSKIFDVVVPTEEEIEVKDGKRRTVERRVFPGYILVQMLMDEDSWYVVRNTPGVTGFVGMGNEPTPLRQEEVAQIVKRMEAEAPRIKVTYKAGQKVRIIDGPFNDFIGTVSDIDMERAKVRVMVSFFGRETPVELDFLQVEKA